MADVIKTSFTVSLGGDEAANTLSAEVDTRAAKDGGVNIVELGKTSNFVPGDNIAFFVYASSGVDVDYVLHSLQNVSGAAVAKVSSKILDMEDNINFDGSSRTANLSKPLAPGAAISVRWIGNDLEQYYGGVLTVGDDGVTLELPELPDAMRIQSADSDAVKAAKLKQQRRPGACVVSYTSQAQVWKLQTPTKTQMSSYGDAPYPVAVHIYGKTV